MRRRLIAFTLLPVLCWLGNAAAFKPKEATGHTGVTIQGLAAVSGFDKRKFSREAKQKIVDYTNDVDNPVRKGREFWEPTAHCDDELLPACSDRIATLTGQAISNLCKSNEADSWRQSSAWWHLGRALHTLQDFYSHSNFVNLAYGDQLARWKASVATGGPGAQVNEALVKGEPLHAVDKARRTCEDDHYTYHPTRTEVPLTSGYFPGPGQLVVAAAGGWVGSGIGGGLGGLPGILLGADIAHELLLGEPGKCDHGVDPVPVKKELTVGINKDRLGIEEDAWHGAAFDSAVRSTKLTVERIARAVAECQDGTKGLDLFFGGRAPGCTEMDCPGAVTKQTFGVVIDTTKSMGSSIAGIGQALQEIALGTQALNLEFVLVTFGDPYIGTPKVGLDVNELLTEVAALEAGVPDDGGDCPEPVLAAVSRAVDVLPDGASVLLFTDTESKEPELQTTLLKTLARKHIALYVMQPATHCVDNVLGAPALRSPVGVEAFAAAQNDPGAYWNLSARSGGQVHAVSDSAEEIGAFLAPILARPASDEEQDLLSHVSALPADALTLTLPIDRTASELLVSVTFGGGAVGSATLRAPDGTVVTPDVSGTSASLHSVKAPKTGSFTLALKGTKGAMYSVRARVKSELRIAGVEFLVEEGRPGHEGWFPNRSKPVSGVMQKLRMDMDGTYESVAFELIDGAGRTLEKLGAVEDDQLEGRFMGDVTPPKESFRVRAHGKTANGDPFERVTANLLESSDVAVGIGINAAHLVPGQIFKARFVATNFGKKQAYAFSGATSFGRVRAVTPKSATLATDESVEFVVEVEIPQDATADDAGSEGLVTMTGAASAPDSTDVRGNATFLSRYLEVDGDGDGVPNASESGDAGAESDFDGNDDGVPDAEQPNVVSTRSRGETGYLTFALPKGQSFSGFRTHFAPGVTEQIARDFPLDAVSFQARVEAPSVELVTTVHRAPPYSYAGARRYGDVRGTAEPGWEDVATQARQETPMTFVTALTDGAAEDQDSIPNGAIDLTLAVTKAPTGDTENAPASEGGCHLGRGATGRGGSPAASLMLALLALLFLRNRQRRDPTARASR